MTGRSASLIWVVVLGVAVGLFAGVWLIPHLQRITEQTATLGKLDAEGQQLAARVEELTRALNESLAEPGDQTSAEKAAQLSVAEARARVEAAKRLQDVRLLAEVQKRLEGATKTIAELQDRVEQLEKTLATVNEEKRQLAETAQDLQERLTHSDRIIEAMQTELKGNSDRLVKLEVRYRKLKQQKQEADNKLKRSVKLIQQLESVQRRREALLRNIVRRYREVSEQYRAVALQVNNPDQFSSSGVDLSRLQNAVTLAEEDLRQLRPLNARARCLQKELHK